MAGPIKTGIKHDLSGSSPFLISSHGSSQTLCQLSLSAAEFHWLSPSLSSSLFPFLQGIFGSAPFVVGISISELDCGYQSEAGGHVGKSQQQTQWRRAENPVKKLYVRKQYLKCWHYLKEDQQYLYIAV